jgi:hypothetical protein
MGTNAHLDIGGEGKRHYCSGKRTPVVKPVTNHFTSCAIPAG